MVDRINAAVVRVLLALAAALIFALSFLVVADVIGRGVFNSPVKGTPEMVSMSIVIVCFLLAGYSVQSGSMLRADVLIGALGWRGPILAALLSGVLGSIFFILIAWGSIEPFAHALASGEYEGEGALRIPVWPARVVVMAGSVLVVVIYVTQSVAAVAALLGDPPPDRRPSREIPSA